MASKLRRDVVYWLIVAAVAFFLHKTDSGHKAHFWTYDYGDERKRQTLVVCVLSMLANLGVVAYHSTYPPHPKFDLLPRRRLSLRIHIISGLTEIFSMVAAFFAPDPTYFAVLASLAALCGHVPSATYQWPIVFGIKSVMIPMYFVFILSHFVTAVSLLMDPTDGVKLTKLCIALHGYVWVRVSIAVFHTMNILREVEYSVAIFFAGFLMAPMLFGVGANFYYVLTFLVFHFVVGPIVHRMGLHWGADNQEYSREMVTTDERKREVAMRALAALEPEQRKDFQRLDIRSDQQLAEIVFNRLDKDGNGKLEVKELEDLVVTLGHPPSDAAKWMKKWDTDLSGELSFQEFYTHVWNFQSSKSKLFANYKITSVPKKQVTDEEMARVVFQSLGRADEDELDTSILMDLLCSWGLPQSEVREYMAMFDDNKDGVIDFNEFKAHFGPFYRYSYLLLATDLDNAYMMPRRKQSGFDGDTMAAAAAAAVTDDEEPAQEETPKSKGKKNK